MKATELFNGLHEFRVSGQTKGLSPTELEKRADVTVHELPPSNEDMISHREYITEDGRVEEEIISHDTSRTFKISYDIDTFHIYLYDKDNHLINKYEHQSTDEEYYRKAHLI